MKRCGSGSPLLRLHPHRFGLCVIVGPGKSLPPPLILPTLERFLALKWLTVGPGFLFCLGVRPLGLTGIRSAWCPLLGTSILATSACETGRYGLWCDVRRGAFVERMHYHSPTADPICLLPLVALSLQEHTYTCTHARRDEDSSFY